MRLLAQATKEDLRGGKKPGGSSKKASEAQQLQDKGANGTKGGSKADASGKDQEQGDKNGGAKAEQEQEQEQEQEAGAEDAEKDTDEAEQVSW